MNLNRLEKNEAISEGKTTYEMVSQYYNQLVAGKQVSRRDKEQMAILYYTKEINPPYFFSLSFTVGVYLPLFAPLVFPPTFVLFGMLKLIIKAALKKEKPA